MRYLLVFSMLTAVFLTSCAGQPDARIDDRVSKSEALLPHFLDTGDPGCSAAVSVDGAMVWAEALGVADIDSGEPLTTDSVFDFASASKQFTGIAILLLDADGVIATTDTLDVWVPGLPEWAEAVTLTDLLHHTSGIPDYGDLLENKDIELSDSATQHDALLSIKAVDQLHDAPGTSFEYSNSNYVLLAEVAANASDVSFPNLLSKRVFVGHELRIEPGFAGAVSSYDSRQPVRSGWLMLGDGSAYGTPSELSLWADHYRTGAIGGEDLVKNATADTVLTGDEDGSSYGAGIEVSDDGTLSHGGEWAGTVTSFEVTPDRRTVTVVSCNTADGPAEAIGAELREIWSHPVYSP